MKDLPGEFAEAIPRILTETCFGDFYTRGGLDIKTRELMIFCALATLGGTDRQMGSHAVGNMKVGNDKETLLSALVQLIHILVFPGLRMPFMQLKMRRLKKMFIRINNNFIKKHLENENNAKKKTGK